MTFFPFFSLLIYTCFPPWILIEVFNLFTRILGPARSANIVGLIPDSNLHDLIRSKHLAFSVLVPCERLTLKQVTPLFIRYCIFFCVRQLGPTVAIIFVSKEKSEIEQERNIDRTDSFVPELPPLEPPKN